MALRIDFPLGSIRERDTEGFARALMLEPGRFCCWTILWQDWMRTRCWS